jgi:hypothetical protein
MRPIALVYWCAACAILPAGSAAVASPLYEFTFDQPNYTVAPGGSVYVTVFLEETPGADISVLDANGVGMYGAGVTLMNVAPLPDDPAKVLAAAGIELCNRFNDPDSARKGIADSPSTLAYLSEVTDGTLFVHADDPTPGQPHYLMPVGRFLFTAGATPGVTFLQTGINPLVAGAVNITASGEVLDSYINHTGARITTTPEPSAMVLVATALLGFAALRCLPSRRGS